MVLELNAGKLLRLFAPFWLLLGLSVLVNRQDYEEQPLWLLMAFLPFLAAWLLWTFGRRRWRLELTPTELILHTIVRSERFAWSRMGPLWLKGMHAPHQLILLLFVRTLWFRYPLDPQTAREHLSSRIGRRVLLVFGDRNAQDTLDLIEDWRVRHGGPT